MLKACDVRVTFTYSIGSEELALGSEQWTLTISGFPLAAVALGIHIDLQYILTTLFCFHTLLISNRKIKRLQQKRQGVSITMAVRNSNRALHGCALEPMIWTVTDLLRSLYVSIHPFTHESILLASLPAFPKTYISHVSPVLSV